MRPLAVVYLCEFASLNGGEHSLLAVLPFVLRAGVRATVLVPENGDFPAMLREMNIPALPLPFAGTDALAYKRERLAEALLGLREAGRCDLLHANSLSMGRLAGPVASALGLPGISHLRDIINLPRAAIDDLNRHILLLAVSEATRQFHIAQGIEAARCRTLYNGVDIERFSPGERTGYLHRELDLPFDARSRAPLLAMIGQIGLRKGQDTLLDAVEIIANKMRGFHKVNCSLLFVGRRWSDKAESRDYEQRLRERAAHGPLAGHVRFVDLRTDISGFLREIDVLVHPARQEPLGRVLLEAAASGCAVVASDVGGSREIFPPGSRTALLVPPEAPEALAEAMLALLAAPRRRAALGCAARARAVEAFDVRIAAENLLTIYRSLFGQKTVT